MKAAIQKAGVAIAGLAWLSTPALAHHAMGGKLPSTFTEGLLSGLAHPVIGPDHFAFIVAIGIAAAIVPQGLSLIAAFLAASTLGVFAHIAAFDLPLSEILVACSVILAGGLIALGLRAGSSAWLPLVLVAGLLHGYAFGESIVGADRPVLGAYLVGIAIVSAAVATAISMLARAMIQRGSTMEMPLRAAGVVVGAVGVLALAGGLAS